MKIKSYYTIMSIPTKAHNEYIQLLEATGAQKRKHHIKLSEAEYYVMEDACGNRMDYVYSPKYGNQAGFFGFRVNVDDIQEALAHVQEGGYNIVTPLADEKTCFYFVYEDTHGIKTVMFQHKKINVDIRKVDQ